jgi:dihydroflavonol-4-reductase
MQKVVVTGAAGHVGANLVRDLLAGGYVVQALVHTDRRALAGLALETVEGDLSDLASLRRAFEGAAVVFHLASHISLLRSEKARLEAVNVIGTRNVVRACLDCGVDRLIHFSSIEALSPFPPNAPVNESRGLAGASGVSSYGRSKAAAEREVQSGIAHGLDAVIIRPTAVIGPHDYKPSHFGQALVALANGTLSLLVDGGFNWVDVRDVARGAVRAAACAPRGAAYILGGTWASVRDLADIVDEITGVARRRLTAPLWLALVGAPFMTAFARVTGQRPLYTAVSLNALHSYREVSHERATRELGYAPRPLRETLVDTLRWFAQAGYLRHPITLPESEEASWLPALPQHPAPSSASTHSTTPSSSAGSSSRP